MPQIQPRLIRFRDAPAYCGMSESFFNSRIRPLIAIEIVDGSKFLAFDRLDLDDAIDEYKRLYGNPKDNQNNEISEKQKVNIYEQALHNKQNKD